MHSSKTNSHFKELAHHKSKTSNPPCLVIHPSQFPDAKKTVRCLKVNVFTTRAVLMITNHCNVHGVFGNTVAFRRSVRCELPVPTLQRTFLVINEKLLLPSVFRQMLNHSKPREMGRLYPTVTDFHLGNSSSPYRERRLVERHDTTCGFILVHLCSNMTRGAI